MAVSLYKLIVLGSAESRCEVVLLYHVLSWGLPAVLTAVLLSAGQLGHVGGQSLPLWCWIVDADGGQFRSSTNLWVGVIDALRCAAFVVIAIIYARRYCAFASLVHDGWLDPLRERRAVRRLWLHLLVYMATRAVYLYIGVHSLLYPGVDLPRAVYLCGAVGAASMGLLNAIVYGVAFETATNKCCASMHGLARPLLPSTKSDSLSTPLSPERTEHGAVRRSLLAVAATFAATPLLHEPRVRADR